MGGPCPIPFAEIFAYLLLVGIDGRSERLKYVNLMQRLDGVYMKYWADKNKKA
jgi:hypothetical protein